MTEATNYYLLDRLCGDMINFTHFITNSMKQIPTWEANSYTGSQEITCLS
jgi:hypothetical protein